MNTEQQTYSSKSTASKGAKRLGITNPELKQNDDGRWFIIPPKKRQAKQAAPKPKKKEAPAEKQETNGKFHVETSSLVNADFAELERKVLGNLEESDIATGQAVVIDSLTSAANYLSMHTEPLTPPSGGLSAIVTALPAGIDLSNPSSIVPKRSGSGISYAELEAASPSTSTIANPSEFVRSFLDQCPTLDRKTAISIMVKYGVNINTAKTQYQLWHAAGGVRKK